MDKVSLAYTYWQDEDMWIGCLDDFPDYMTQGMSMEELKENLLDVHKELGDKRISCRTHHQKTELIE